MTRPMKHLPPKHVPRRALLSWLAPAFAAAMLFAALAPGARADDKFTLKVNVKAGDKWSFDTAMARNMTMKVTVNGQDIDVKQNVTQKRKGTVEVLDVKDGLPVALKVSFDRDCGDTADNNGRKGEQPFPLAEKTVTVKKDADGKITTDLPANTDPMVIKEVEGSLHLDNTLYSKDPVGLKDEWNIDPADAARQFELGPDDKVRMHCTLVGLTSAGGRKTADIAIAGNLVKTDQGLTVSMTLGGVSQVDLITGQTLQGDVIGQIQPSKAPQDVVINGQQAAILITGGKIEMHHTVKPLEGGDAPAPAGTLVGTYKNEQITLELKDGVGGKYSGMLTIGDKKFPVNAALSGDSLTGTFTSGDKSFDMTAKLSGDTLTLTSGGHDHALKRERNPLDDDNPLNPKAPEKPKNPLDQ